jgi:DNA topoisomerase-1
MGEEFSAKDFRTWGGTLVAATQLIAAKTLESQAERDKFVVEVVKNTADRLGNTPAVARGSYIDPRVISAYVAGKAIDEMRDTLKGMKPKKYMSRDEVRVMHLLSKTR